MQNYIYIKTYGCTANQNNSEILKGILKSRGYEITNNPKIADIIILNTCIVKQKTKNKIIRRIQDITKKFPNKLLIITGCMPETESKSIKQLTPNSIQLGTHHFSEITKIIKEFRENKLNSKKQKQYLEYQEETKLSLPKIPNNKLISINQISEGCLGNCSYCLTKIAKGKLFSYPEKQILKSIKSDLQNGAKEIWLTSQDNANYNMDNGSQKLPKLLKEIIKLPHRFKLRLGMMDPNNVILILNQLIDIYKSPKIYKFLHLPIQSASDKVLKHMNRLYTIKEAENIIKKFKKEFPDITISTDIIIGYPTETQTDHKKNVEFLKKYKLDVLNLSKFSSHKQTKAGKLKTLPSSIIHKRASELMKIHKKTALQNKQKFLGKTLKVFANKKMQDGMYEARDDNYNIVIINSKENILGKNIKTKITNTGVHHLRGEIINQNIFK